MTQASDDPIVASLRRALDANPGDVVLRLHLAQTLLTAGNAAGAIAEASIALQADPGNGQALGLLAAAATALSTPAGPAAPAAPAAPAGPAESSGPAASSPATSGGFDWEQAEQEVGSAVPPPFVERVPVGPLADDDAGAAPVEIAREAVTLSDVGGLDDVKRRLEESFLAPMRNAAVARAFGKSLRGGLLLYGPPGCGKTFLARAVAGELGAVFMSVTMTDILDPYHGVTEKNMKAVFDSARAHSPTVLFLDEVDAIGMKRSGLGHHAMIRQMVNQLLIEMDSMAGNNDGLYLLAATNHPWDLDEALLRPGRLDRTLLVTPPDFEARRTILEYHLRDRPLAGIDLTSIASRTEMFSGADLAHICVTAAEKAMTESIQANRICPISMTHIDAALEEIGPSTLAWLESSRNVVKFSNDHGRYNDLAEYLRSRSIL